MSNQMQVTLKLWCDQQHLQHNQEASLIWELFVNGKPFPCGLANIIETTQIDGIVRKLVDIEEEMTDRDA